MKEGTTICEPISGTAGTIAIVATVASAVVGAAGAYLGAQAQADAAHQQAKVSGYLARDAILRGRREEQAERERVRRILGMQRAAFGASGGVVDVGSALDVLEDTAYFGELDALTIRANAEREEWYHKSNRAQAMAAASTYRQQGYLGAAGALIGGLAGTAANLAQGSPSSTVLTGAPGAYALPASTLSDNLIAYRPPSVTTSRGARSLG